MTRQKLPMHVIKEIYRLREVENLSWSDIVIEIEDEFSCYITMRECKQLLEEYIDYIEEEKTGIDVVGGNVIEIPDADFDLFDMHVVDTLKGTQFIDIETSLIDAKVFRTGKQNINANQLTSDTRILTVAGGSFYDLYTKGADGIWGHSNSDDHDTFLLDPLDDTHVLRQVWKILDDADTIIAHNARFDKSWLLGRFLELGWKLPSKFNVVCTFRSLWEYNMTSKKLDELAKSLVGTAKIQTDFDLWMRCSEGDPRAFAEMLRYNKGDIYDTLYKVYMRTCQYIPNTAVDMSDPKIPVPQCKVTGQLLEKLAKRHHNSMNGLSYFLYRNPYNGLVYVDRYNTNSKKADCGLVKPYK